MTNCSHGCKFQLYSSSYWNFQLYAFPLLCLLLYHYIPILFMSASKINTVVDNVPHLRGCDNVWEIENGRSIGAIREELWTWCWRLQALFHFSFQAWKSCYVFFSMWGYMSCTYLPQWTLRPNIEREWGCLKWHREADGCVGAWPAELKRCRQAQHLETRKHGWLYTLEIIVLYGVFLSFPSFLCAML